MAHRLQNFEGHIGWIWSVAFSPDGKTLVSGCEDGTLLGCLGWKVPLKPCRDIQEVRCSCLQSRWAYLAAAMTKQYAAGMSAQAFASELRGHTGSIWSVAFSHDGRSLASGCDDQTLSYGMSAQALPQNLAGDITMGCGRLPSVRMVKPGVMTKNGTLLGCQRRMPNFAGTPVRVRSYSFSQMVQPSGCEPNGTLLGCQHNACKTLGHTSWIKSASLCPIVKPLASGCDDKTVRLWNVSTGLCLRTWDIFMGYGQLPSSR